MVSFYLFYIDIVTRIVHILKQFNNLPYMISAAKTVVTRTQPSSRVRFIEGSEDDRSLLAHLGKFDLVYSTISLHHWKYPVKAIRSMFQALREGGMMILHDLKRVSWLYMLHFRYQIDYYRKILERVPTNFDIISQFTLIKATML